MKSKCVLFVCSARSFRSTNLSEILGALTVLFVSIFIVLGTANNSRAEVRCDPPVGKMKSVEGDVKSLLCNQPGWTAARPDDQYCLRDMIQVGVRSRALVVLQNETAVRLDQNTTLVFSEGGTRKHSVLEMIKGAAHFISPLPRMLNVVTPFVDAFVDGTEFVVMADGEKTVIVVYQGDVKATNASGELRLIDGQAAEVYAGRAPVHTVVAKPRDAVQWSLYYPPVSVSIPARGAGADNRLERSLVESMEAASARNLPEAFHILESVPEQARTPLFHNCRAGLLLSVGRADEALSDIDAALAMEPDNSDSHALKSIMATVDGRKEDALELGRKARAFDPDSASALLALSYALQSRFLLEEARDAVREAVEKNPENALVRARLSELNLSLQDYDGAVEEARKAVEIDPEIGMTQTVLGFAHLVAFEISSAKASFERAVELDQAAPLPRLGLGLALIHEGNMEEGRREIEIAASLDPNNSLIRSYLGKAYFELKRNEKAADQFRDAKTLDPNDPTPWLYDAIKKQTENRPVEALSDIEKSMGLNDNRAVYRSRLMLDDDAAARGASLARIYGDLGFEQVALAEGYKSVETDPTNAAAHRFLSDTYASKPRHEIARVSQLLRSQLLQPVSVLPVQPRLAVSQQYIYQGQGPSDLGYNEFTRLFDRDGVDFRASGLLGGNDTYSDEVTVSGLQGNVSFSLGQFHYETDGTRDNNDQEQNIYNLFCQARLSESTSVQAEFRDYERESGDLTLRFDPDNFDPVGRNREDRQTVRLGLHHSFSPSSDLLLSAIYQDFTIKQDFPYEDSSLDIDVDGDNYMAEGQHIASAGRSHFISGAGHTFSSDKTELAFSARVPFPPFSISSVTEDESDVRNTNFYHYASLNFPENFVWTLGASADFFERGLKDRNQFNPKLGVSWTPWEKTTVRAAAFRVLKKLVVSDQTLEPTQVAGFNQFFDDFAGADAWRYGIGLDQKFGGSVFGGIELSRRDLDVPFMYMDYTGLQEVREADWDEDLFRAYLYWTPLDWFAVSGEYQYEEFDRALESAGILNIVELKTHRIPVQLSFFHSTGLTARLKGTYVYQDGVFAETTGVPGVFAETGGDDHFATFDASLEYRFPKRFGKIAVEGKNIFDESFLYQEIDMYMPTFYPERQILMSVTVAF